MFERFTDRARRVLVLAQQEARLLDHNFIGTEHILLALIHEGEGVAARALESLGISHEAVRENVEETVTVAVAGAASSGSMPPFTPRAKKVLELSLREAIQLSHNYISTEHILLGLVAEGEGVAAQVLVILGVDLSRVRQQVIQLLSASRPDDELVPVDDDLITPSPFPLGPGDLVKSMDVEALLRSRPLLHDVFEAQRQVGAVGYQTLTFHPKTLPSIRVSVAGAEVTREAFESSASDRDERIDDLGDAATFDRATGSLRVLKGSALFVVTVPRHDDPLGTAVALAEKALARLTEEPGGEHVH